MRYRLYKFNRHVYCYIQYIIIEFALEGDYVAVKPRYIVPGRLGMPHQCTIDTITNFLYKGTIPHWLDLDFQSNNYNEVLTHLFINSL